MENKNRIDFSKDLYRSTTDVRIAGVCGGIAEYFNISSSLVRLIAVLGMVMGGVTPLIYLICWAMMPEGK